MAFDEKQHLDNDQLDLAQLFRIIWSFKYILLILVLLSVPISVWWATTQNPTYKAETVFEKPSKEITQSNNSLLGSIRGLGIMGFLGGGPAGVGSESFISEIRSESFLKTVILNNAKLDSQMMFKFCPLPSKDFPRFSLRSLLIALGLSENRAPSESQKISLLVQCVNKMLEVGFDTFDSVESSAFRLSIESGDPYFSANLANQIVEKYFIRHEQKRDQDFQNVKKYLSRVITEAQLEYTEANKLIQKFKIKNTLLMKISPSSSQNYSPSIVSDDVLLPVSPFVGELNKELANLSRLEKSLSELNRARSLLSNLTDLDHEKIKTFISSTSVQGVLSSTFITAIARINNSSEGAGVINQEIKKIVDGELDSLKRQMQVLEEKIDKLEEQTMQLMAIDNRYQELAIDAAKKKLLFEGLKDQLQEKILTTGLANVEQPVLLTKAVPPFRKASPNKKLIVALGVVLSIFGGIAYVLIRQSYLRLVCSLSQVQSLSKFISCYKIKHRQMKQMGERPDETIMSQSFFSRAKEIGNFGCIVDLSKKRQNNFLASDFSKSVASLLATDNLKIVCLDSSPSRKALSVSSEKNFSSNHSNLNVQGMLNNNILLSNDEAGMVGAGEIKKIKNKYSEYDKIICTLGAEIGEVTKYKFIEQCDFYILIGRSFQFDEFNFKKFSNDVWEKEKCLGFFLID